jgi:hypothetical protein
MHITNLNCTIFVIFLFLLLDLCILIVRLSWLRFFHAFSSVVRQMPGYNSPSRGTARTLPKFLCCSQNFCVVLCIVSFVSFCVLFVCKCVLYNCHWVATQLQLTNISRYIIQLLFLLPYLKSDCNKTSDFIFFYSEDCGKEQILHDVLGSFCYLFMFLS